MNKTPCEDFLQKVKAFYIVDELDEFLAWKQSDGNKDFTLVIKDRISKTILAKAYLIYNIEKKAIDLVTLDRYKTGNTRETYYKGLGKVLLYILVCKAIELNYMIRFKADDYDGNLIQYYLDRGFTQAVGNNKRIFNTMPTREDFNSRIAETIAEIKDPSAIEYFKPIWIQPAKKGQPWMIECPVCHIQANPNFQTIQHKASCENKEKIADLSERPKSGGRRTRRMIGKTRKASRKYRK